MKRVRKIADEFARDMRIKSLPIEVNKLEEIVENNNWKIVTYSKGLEFIKSEKLERYYYTSKGFTYSSPDYTIIFIRDDLEYLDKINVICHEIGHLVLRHIDYGTKQKGISTETTAVQELEADAFALELQAPKYLIEELKISGAQELIEKGVFSKENAKQRFKYYLEDTYLKNVHPKLLFALLVIIVVFVFRTSKYGNPGNPDIITESTTSLMETTINATTETTTAAATDNNENVVYITKSGSKYHHPDCRYVKDKNPLSITLQEAESQGYSACSVCYK